MAYYRCYFLSPANSFMAVEVVHTDTDADAIVQASVLVAKRPLGTGFDLWQRGRHVYKHLSSPRHSAAAIEGPASGDCLHAMSARCPAGGAVVPMTLSEARRMIRAAATRAHPAHR